MFISWRVKSKFKCSFELNGPFRPWMICNEYFCSLKIGCFLEISVRLVFQPNFG